MFSNIELMITYLFKEYIKTETVIIETLFEFQLH